MWEVAFWNTDGQGNIERTSHVPDVAVPARYPHEVTIHQGRIERILSDDLARYSERGVDYSSKIISVIIDEVTDPEYPVVVEVEKIGDSGKENLGASSTRSKRSIRAKHLVGCDGAHSVVRRAMGLDLVGDSRDHIWGVVDLVVDTDFPDIRRRCAIHSSAGSVMVIPRERIATGDYLTRLYVQVNIEVPADELSGADVSDPANNDADTEARRKARERRAKITLEGLLQQAQAVFKPYNIKLKDGAGVDWWAAYQVGQRMTEQFLQRSSDGVPRLFIAGDGK
jgi:phenol 2-monooxygenase